jgi:hypothetical protein
MFRTKVSFGRKHFSAKTFVIYPLPLKHLTIFQIVESLRSFVGGVRSCWWRSLLLATIVVGGGIGWRGLQLEVLVVVGGEGST